MGATVLTLGLAALLGAASLRPCSQWDAAARVEELLRESRFVEALAMATSAQDAGVAARLEARVRWTAGDLDGALGAAREGLVAAPLDAPLAQLASSVAFSLDLAREGRRHLSALDAALAATPPQDDAARAWWIDARARLEEDAQRAEGALAARDRALVRARRVGGALLILASLAFMRLLVARAPTK